MHINSSNESGRSMIEMLGVIAIIGVISIGGITSMSYVDSYFRSSATLLEVEQMARDINDMYSWAPNYSGLNNDKICNEDIVKCSGNKIPNRWGGEVTVNAMSDGNSYRIIYTQVSESACERIVEQWQETLLSMSLSSSTTCNGDSNSLTFISR